MGKESSGQYQPELEGFSQEAQVDEVSFRVGVTIFPEGGGRGDLRTDLKAKKLPHKIKGLSGYISLERIDLEYRNLGPTRYWSLPMGTRFGTWSKYAHAPKK